MNEIYIYLNEDGTIVGWGDGYSEGAVLISVEPESDLLLDYMSYKYVDGQFIKDYEGIREAEERMRVLQEKEEARIFLAQTQNIVQQHRDELDLGVPTTLTDAEYKALLRERIEKSKILQVLS